MTPIIPRTVGKTKSVENQRLLTMDERDETNSG
jgi:hypothetical protein